MNTFVFTCGDPNGIGSEIIIKSLNNIYHPDKRFILISPQEVLTEVFNYVKPSFPFEVYDSYDSISSNKLDHVAIINFNGEIDLPGKPTRESGRISFESLNIAMNILEKNKNHALITAPISKEAWKLNGIKNDGHTDYLADKFNAVNPLMIFYSSGMIAALATIHKAIKLVPSLLSQTFLRSVISAYINSLKNDFKIVSPKLAVLGLNPHAGEGGAIGLEEIEIIKPVIEEFTEENVNGPFVSDAFFGLKLHEKYDAILGMYHDQVLIPFKMLYFDEGVNFTANLPIVRTSPDHGTAFDIAYQNKANPNSMIQAYKLAEKVLRNRELTSK